MAKEKKEGKVTFNDLLSGKVKLEFGNLEQIAAIDKEILRREIMKKEDEWTELINRPKENIYG